MKKLLLPILTLTAAFGLSGCMDRASAVPNNASFVFPVVDDDGFEHMLFEGDNTVEGGFIMYCGNTETTISRNTEMGGEPWEKTFMYEDSVTLTDLLLHLDYSGDICKCLPEYNIKTELGRGKEYGVSLSEGYARYDGGQVSLTGEQVELIRDIINRLGG